MGGFQTTVAILSLNMTAALVNAGYVAGTLPITGATVTTPIAVTSPAHGVPLGRTVHAVVAGVVGTTEANGLWELTPTDTNTFTLATYTAQGVPQPSVGTNAYVSGGTISYGLADYRILLGRRWIAATTAVVSPRIVFVPTLSRKPWDFFPYGGQGPAPRQQLGSLEQQTATTQPLTGTKYDTFEVHITGATNPPSPDAGDFDAVELLEDTLFITMFDALTPPVFTVMATAWPSQDITAGSQTQRGQKKILWLEIARPVARIPAASFVPSGTSLVVTVEPVDPLVPDDLTVISVSPPP